MGFSEIVKDLDLLDPNFLVPAAIGIIILFIILKVARKLIKIALVIALIILVTTIFF